jgi:hypothetical protein
MESMSTIPPFLDAREIARNCADANLGEAATATLLDLAQRIRADPDLRAIASAAHHCVYETREDFTAALSQADAVFGAVADVLHALLVLDSMRLVREKQQARGVPSEIARAINQRHAVAWLNDAIAKRGHVGIPDWMPGWFRTVGSGELYRLGRLEFVLQAWDYPFRAYANIHTHEVIVLAEAGQRFTQDGNLACRSRHVATPSHSAYACHTQSGVSCWARVIGCWTSTCPPKARSRWMRCAMRLPKPGRFSISSIPSVHLSPMYATPGSSARNSKPC